MVRFSGRRAARYVAQILGGALVMSALALPATVTEAQSARGCAVGQAPSYVFGFADLHAWLGDSMGEPTTCEYADPNGTGDTEQNTTAGLAFWRKSTNTPTFTNGWDHWARTPQGQLTWAGASIDPPPDAMVVVTAWTPPPPTKTTGCLSKDGLPDAGCTPGALNPAVSPETIATTICTSGYTARVRPPTSYTSPLERQLLVAYGQPGAPPANYELDHLISLELGGAPRDPANLWPEPYAGEANARQKDVVENYLHQQVCNRVLPLREAQRLIATDWLSVYHQIRP
jgi:hypothetical protein